MTAVVDEAARTNRAGGRRTRMCAVTRRVLPERELIRFVAAPDGTVVPDLKARLPGRGIWVSLDRATVATALRKGAFARGLKTNARAADDLPDHVTALLRQAALGRLGLARKAGELAVGFVAAEAALAGGTGQALVIAAEAAADGRRKLMQAMQRSGNAVRVIRAFTSEELGLALGRSNVIHAAVLRGPAGRSFIEAADRLDRYAGAGVAGGESGPESAETGE